jgi:pimeloyl-ACP methyl ester carboxylesterase
MIPSSQSNLLLICITLFLFLLRCIAQTTQPQFVLPASKSPPTPQLPRPRESGYVNLSSGVDVWYAQFGAPLEECMKQHALPILFLHGGFANSDYFGHQISALLEHGTHSAILSIDSRMQGRSTGLEGSISYTLMREDVVVVLDHFSIPSATIIGWSDGGIIGLDLATIRL